MYLFISYKFFWYIGYALDGALDGKYFLFPKLYNFYLTINFMRKRMGFIIFIIFFIMTIVSYLLFPAVRRFVDASSVIVTIVAFLISILTWLFSFPTRKLIDIAHYIGSSLSYATSTSVVLIIVVTLVTWNVHLRNVSSYNYILSSISQGLAAIFALIFTITLVLSQILGNDLQKTKGKNLYVFPGTLLLMFLYALGIIIPLLAMQSESELFLDLCIILASICIFSLIPYFVYLGSKRIDRD